MHCNDHPPAHFHAKYGEYEAVVAIMTGEVVDGRLPPRVLGLVQEWREFNERALVDDLGLARERRALRPIKPLE